MSDPDGKKTTGPVLSDEEQITLRRVAFGESPTRTLRNADLVQLRALRLIEEGKDGPMLTSKGRQLYETLPRALGAASFDSEKAARETKR